MNEWFEQLAGQLPNPLWTLGILAAAGICAIFFGRRARSKKAFAAPDARQDRSEIHAKPENRPADTDS